MGTRGTIILALLVVAGAAYLLYEGPPPEQQPQLGTLLGEPRAIDPTQPVTLLLEFEPGEIVSVALAMRHQRLEAKRQGDSWIGANGASIVPDFLSNLKGLAILMEVEADPVDLSLYGLDPPESEIELGRRSGEALVLLLGDRNPAGTGAYVRIGRNGRVVLAGALILWEFEKAYRAMGG